MLVYHPCCVACTYFVNICRAVDFDIFLSLEYINTIKACHKTKVFNVYRHVRVNLCDDGLGYRFILTGDGKVVDLSKEVYFLSVISAGVEAWLMNGHIPV